MKSKLIMMLRPMKRSDPTEHTFSWAQKAVDFARSLDYNIIDIQKDDVNYDNVTSMIAKYKPRLLMSFSHGCPTSLQGQNDCSITRRFDIDQLLSMDPDALDKLINPVKSSCPGICKVENEICNPLCLRETNIGLLKGSIIFACACHTAAQPTNENPNVKSLGNCAIKYGVEAYCGYSDLLMFPVDSLGSQDMFGEVQLTFVKELLLGHTVAEAEAEMSKLEDQFIRKNKNIKYLSLPMLWDKLHRKVLGNPDAMIY